MGTPSSVLIIILSDPSPLLKDLLIIIQERFIHILAALDRVQDRKPQQPLLQIKLGNRVK